MTVERRWDLCLHRGKPALKPAPPKGEGLLHDGCFSFSSLCTNTRSPSPPHDCSPSSMCSLGDNALWLPSLLPSYCTLPGFLFFSSKYFYLSLSIGDTLKA